MGRKKVGGFLLSNLVLKRTKSDIKTSIILKCYSLPAKKKIFSNAYVVCTVSSGGLH